MRSQQSAPAVRRLGILGGSFDPIHMAHLVTAEVVREALNLDLVLFLPAGEQPLKQGRPVTPAEHRVAMVELAIAGNPAFALSRADVDRPGPSYTVDTLRELKDAWQSRGNPDLWFIIGADSLTTFLQWRDPAGILARARLAVVRRPGFDPDLLTLYSQVPALRSSIDWIDAPLLDISATNLRHRVSHHLSIRYQVPDLVRAYIQTHQLYQAAGPS